MVALPNEAVERVGKFEMEVRFGDLSAESDERWQRRSHVLAAWLREKWQMERGRLGHCGKPAVSQRAERN
jgi:hypothetical protein